MVTSDGRPLPFTAPVVLCPRPARGRWRGSQAGGGVRSGRARSCEPRCPAPQGGRRRPALLPCVAGALGGGLQDKEDRHVSTQIPSLHKRTLCEKAQMG